MSTRTSDRLKKWCTSFGKVCLPAGDVQQIEAISEESQRADELVQRVKPLLDPLWSFFVALCHALQEGENNLTAEDAYWLGLIDEVIGRDDLWSLRNLAEFRPDTETANEEEKTKNKQGSGSTEAQGMTT